MRESYRAHFLFKLISCLKWVGWGGKIHERILSRNRPLCHPWYLVLWNSTSADLLEVCSSCWNTSRRCMHHGRLRNPQRKVIRHSLSLPPPLSRRLIFWIILGDNRLISYLYTLPSTIECYDREESEKYTNTSIRTRMKNFFWYKHHDRSHKS